MIRSCHNPYSVAGLGIDSKIIKVSPSTPNFAMLPNVILAAAVLFLASASPLEPSKRAGCADMSVSQLHGVSCPFSGVLRVVYSRDSREQESPKTNIVKTVICSVIRHADSEILQDCRIRTRYHRDWGSRDPRRSAISICNPVSHRLRKSQHDGSASPGLCCRYSRLSSWGLSNWQHSNGVNGSIGYDCLSYDKDGYQWIQVS
jgi:hypothetical protein